MISFGKGWCDKASGVKQLFGGSFKKKHVFQHHFLTLVLMEKEITA